MFSKAFVATLALVGAVSALPSPNGGSTTSGPQCCQNVTNSSQLDPSTAGVFSGKPLPLCFLFGSLLSHTLSASLIGVNCVPILLNL
jgi:hypothetical protein